MERKQISSLVVSASIWSLLQSIVNVIVASLGITAYRCDFPMTGNSIEYSIYVLYLFSTSCSNLIDLSVLSSSQGFAVLAVTPFTADRTLRWMLVQLVIACFWIVTSLLMLVGSLNRVYGRYSLFFCGPWFVCSSLAIFSDAIACITYITDIPQTTELTKLLNFIGASYAVNNVQEESGMWVASALVATYFGRGFVFWVANIFFLVAVMRDFLRLSNRKTNGNQQVVLNEDTASDNQTRDLLDQNSAQIGDRVTVNNQNPDKQRGPDTTYLTTHHNLTPYPILQEQDRFDLTLSARQQDITKDTSMSSLPQRLECILDNAIKRNSLTSNNARNHDSVSLNTNQIPDAFSFDESLYSKNIYVESDLDYQNNDNKRNSSTQPESPGDIKLPSRSMAAIELRGQLPWSYISEAVPAGAAGHRMRDQLPDDEELPPVPVPDYTLHYPHRKRKGVKRDSSTASKESENFERPNAYEGSRYDKKGNQWQEVLY